MKKLTKIFALISVLTLVLSLILINGIDTDWGKVETTRLELTSADGDRICALLYKPVAASPENKVPMVMINHGGSDMFEQMGSYCVELARRGYACITWDHTGAHNSDQATGTAETAPGAKSGAAPMGAETIWNLVKSYNFVDFDKIITAGHSMGGSYTVAFAVEHQEEVFLQVNIGMNSYGSAKNHDHNFHFANVLGVADESTLARSNNNVASVFQAEQIRRVFFGDYTSALEDIPNIEIGKQYTVTGTNGKEYHRTAYMPESCHAYYLVTNDAIQTVIYAITSEVGLGLDEGVTSYADHGKISTVWQWKDIGFILLLAGTVMVMFVVASALIGTGFFKKLFLNGVENTYSFKKGSPLWIIALVVIALLPALLYRPGMLASRSFLGINISKVWLLGGTSNAYISWQWMVSLAMLVVFLLFHFLWGRKHGGNALTYGFATSNEKKFDITYIGRALLYGILVVGSGYLVFNIICAYTKQGMHIATFMISPIDPRRSWCVLMYFLFQIPYFLSSSLAFKAIGLDRTKDDGRGIAKTLLAGIGVAVGSLFLLWFVFILFVTVGHTLTDLNYFKNDRMYIYAIAILPLFIGMSIANALNIFVSKKTKSIWAGLFTALLWGSWAIISCGGLSKIFYF